MKKRHTRVSQNDALFKFSCFLFVILSASAACAADSPPAVSISLNPMFASPGDTISITANASDDLGVRGIYFYYPNSTDFSFQNCSDALTCSKSVSAQVNIVGNARFCVRAIDTVGQLSGLVCDVVGVSLDRPPIIKYFRSEQSVEDAPTVHVGGTIKFEIVAEDDNGVSYIYIEDVAGGTIEEHECGNLKTCVYEYKRFFPDEGVFSFCAYAVDNGGQESVDKCIQVNVVKKYSCEPITLNDGNADQTVALRITSQRLYLDKDGLLGYSAQCCKEQGFCEDLAIDSGTCANVGGSLPVDGYRVVGWDPSYMSIEDVLQGFIYPQVLCTTVMNNRTYVGVVDNYNYKIVGQTQNLEENLMTYWLMGELKNVPMSFSNSTQDPALNASNNSKLPAATELLGASLSNGAEVDKYFFAEQLQKEDNETKVSVIVDNVAYSDAMNLLLENECMDKQLESVECQFDCLEPECNPNAPCGSGNCLGCPEKAPCECCPQCHKLVNYQECQYQKYESMYGRPEADYLFCWRVNDLKNTAWCYQKSDQPTSAVNYPWYSMTRKDTGYYRSLDKITDEYINDQHRWNANVTIQEKPADTGIAKKTWVPEVYCNHQFDNKLLRNIWTKIFTVTPRLNDLRNNLTWTRTGNGALYAGGGFRREPACWWECCRKCAPYCDCACTTGCASQICCLQAEYSPPSVNNVIEIRVPDTTVAEGVMEITYNSDNTVATADNGAIKIVSTGNMPFELSAAFSKDESTGMYTVTLVYTPIGGSSGHMTYTANYDQFVIAQDIILNYTLNEDASDFQTGIKESFSTTLVDHVCRCMCPLRDIFGICICPPGCGASADCCCCPSETVSITTQEFVEDSDVSKISLDMKKIEALKLAANSFVDLALGRNILVGLVAFSSPPRCPGGICSSYPLTSDPTPLHDQIDQYRPLDGTCIACGIGRGRDLIRTASGAKYLIVMSDGVPQYCMGGVPCSQTAAKNDAISQATAAKGEGITVHTVALGNTADFAFMERLAQAGGGKYYRVTCDCPLDCIYDRLANYDTENNVVLVSDTTGSMEDQINLNCPGKGIPIIHKFGAVNVSVNGNIDNYMDSDLTTGIRSKGQLYVEATPDIINELSLNAAESSIDFYSMVYPVKHMAWRKDYSHGYWEPGRPYAVGTPVLYNPIEGTRNYFFDQAYGYESGNYNYPKQCQKICPDDCTCNDYDIADVTCEDANGTTYKRDDCVCLPPKGQTYETFCASDRTFHEEEGYYFDFVEMETREVNGDVNVIAGQPGTNPQFTGNLRGTVAYNGNKRLGQTSYIFVSNSNEGTVSKIRTNDCMEVCKYSVGSNPSSTSVDNDGNAWVGNYNSGDVTRLESNTCNVVDTYKVGDGPRAIAVDDENNIWIGNSNDNTLWKLDGKTGNCLIGDRTKNPTCPAGSAPINISDYPYGAVYDCRGNIWVITNHNNVLYKVRTSDAAVIGRYEIGNATYGIAIDRNGDIWLGGSSSGNVYKINGDTGNIICKKTVGAMTKGVAIDRDDNAWVADSDAGEIYKIDGTNCELLGTYPTGSGPIGIGMDFDNHVWAINQNDNTAIKYDLRGNKLCLAPTGDGPYTYSDMAGYNLWQICHGKNLTHSYVRESKGGYTIDFEALNYPNPLLKYQNEKWNDLAPDTNCNDYCREKGLFSAAVCACPQDPAQKGCIYANQTGTGYEYCQTDCGDVFGTDYATKCCCAQPRFKTDDANLTLFIHFRNNESDQTFNLFPKRTETKPYAMVNINVTIREPSTISCKVNDSVKSGDDAVISASLTDPLTGQGIPDEPITIEIEAYGLKKEIRTDSSGKAAFPKFTAGDESTRITCSYAGSRKYTESSGSAYMNIYSLDRIWWFLSPEVLLLFIVLAILAFSYKWFRGGGFDFYSLWDELRGKK